MSRANNFSDVLRHELHKLRPRYNWKVNWKPKKQEKESVDVGGESPRKKTILIEAELRRGAPVANVAKVWKWLADKKLKRPIVLFQGFSKFYTSKEGQENAMVNNAMFLGKQMQAANPQVHYLSEKIDYNPRTARKGGGRMRRAARLFGRRIATRLSC